ncbi:FecR domain-containing protein [Aliifodinibius salicampi]|uniref:FecR domain-containing protein n=1 Tax=Fodinibius salicampi TaxID=1920655 RepID=A0ABT3PWJ9_9BACT|nr:FecR domain-containing protein [Fodinibius salicampi]
MKESDYSFEELIHSESFQNWVKGQAEPEEKKYWDDWVAKASENRLLAMRAQKRIAGFSIKPTSNPNRAKVWRNLQKHIPGKKDHNLKSKSISSSNDRLQWFFRAAAVFLLVASTALAIHFMYEPAPGKQEDQLVRKEVITKYGERKTIKLNDGSSIILNAHSNLVYSVDPGDSNAVEVFLDGEAHFSVEKRGNPEDSPFKVRTSGGYVKVMGTEFVVSTRNQDTQVVLEEGSVALTPMNSGNREMTIMKPGELAEFNADSKSIKTRLVNTDVYSSWTTYQLVFDKTPLDEVMDRLENTFGVKVVVRQADLYERTISGAIDNSSLEVITSALSNTLDTPIIVKDDAVYVDK